MISSFKKQLKGAAIIGALLMGSNAFAQLGLTWTELGPNDVGGRCRSILIDKTNATGNTLYAAGVSGGIFKSTNAGGTWTSINDQAPSLIVSCMDQASNGDIYFGTGEAYIGASGDGTTGFLGKGLFKLINNSTTITQLKDETFFGDIFKVAVSGSTVYVASQAGFFISTDNGVNFTEETASATSSLSPAAHDVKIANNGDVYYSALGAVPSGTTFIGKAKIYYCPVGSTTFTDITPSVITSLDAGRVEIAISPVDPNYVYLAAITSTGPLGAVLASNNKGTNWTTITVGTSTSVDPTLGFGNNYLTIVADSKKADAFFLGSFLLYKWSQNTSSPFGQGTWNQVAVGFLFQSFIPPGIHDLKFMPSNPDFYYVATNSGIHKVSGYPPNNLGVEFTPFLSINKGFNTSQFYSVAIPNFPRNTVVSGNQVVPFQGVGGGAEGNAFVYLSGANSTNTMSSIGVGSSIGYQSDFSKLSPKAMFYSSDNGEVYRTNDVESTTPPSTFYDASYKLGAPGGPGSNTFAFEQTPMRLWENYKSMDSVLFYNEPANTNYLTSNATQTTFTFVNARPQRSAKYDTIYVRTSSAKKIFQPAITTNTYNNSNTTATTFTYNNVRTNTISKYDSVTVRMTSNKRSMMGPVVTTFTNTDPAAKSFSLANIRSMLTLKYDTIVITAVSQKANILTQTVIPVSQVLKIRPTYSLSNITGYNVTAMKSVRVNTCSASSSPTCFVTSTSAVAPGTPNTIYLDNTTFNDSIRYSFGTALNDSCLVTVKVWYSHNQTIYLYPSYTGSLITSVNVLGEANTSSANNNTITLPATPTLTDVIKFTFIDPPNDSSVITVRAKNSFYQHFKIMPVYSGTTTTIASYNVIGDAVNTATATNIKQSNALDTIKYTFRVAPNDSVTVKNTIKLRYAAGDSIIVKNTDVSGAFFNTSKVLTAPLVTSGNPFAATVKLPLQHSARIAVGISAKTTVDGPSVFVVKRPLNFSANPDWVKIVGKNSRVDGPGGVATSNTTTATALALGTTVTRLEWSPSGRYIYFSTEAAASGTVPAAYYLYRVSHLEMIGDSMGDDYSGVFSSDVDSSTFLRKSTGIRTTPVGKFSNPITSIAIAPNDSMVMVTLGGYGNANSVYYSNGHAGKLNANSTDDTNFGLKTGIGLPVIPIYTGLLELNDNKRALIGTENGIYSTMDITAASPQWIQETGGNFPNVPVFQIRQQTMEPSRCYNSGVIYAATHGRGIWTTDKYLSHYYIGIEENKEEVAFDSNMKLFPNPATNSTNIWFKAAGDANYKITVYDINGRTMMQYSAGKLLEGEHLIQMNTAELNSGIYFVSINGTNNFSANTKLVITR